MTQINDIKDLVTVLQEHPEWLHTVRGLIISEDIALLPAKVDALAEDMREVKTTLAQHAETLAQHTETLAGHTVMLSQMSDDVNHLKGDVSHLMGQDFETHAATYAPRRISIPPDTISLNLAYQERRVNIQWLSGLATNSAIAGRITPDEADDLTRADMIFRREDAASNQEHILAEASITLEDRDVRRAHRRALLLAKALQSPATPLVIGTAITPQAQTLADANRVPVVLLVYRQDDQENNDS